MTSTQSEEQENPAVQSLLGPSGTLIGEGPTLIVFVESPESEAGRAVLGELSELDRCRVADSDPRIVAICPIEIWVQPDTEQPEVHMVLDDDRLLAVQLDATYSAQSVDLVLTDVDGSIVERWTEDLDHGVGARIREHLESLGRWTGTA